MWKIIFFLGFGFASAEIIENPRIFTAVSSKTIFPNSVYNISITTENGGGSNPTLFTATISTLNKSYSAQELQIPPGSANMLSLKVKDLSEDTYNLTIKSDTSGIKFEDIVTIFLDKKNVTILIQSDKPIYKPGETIRFRVIVLDRYFKPFKQNQKVEIKIFDPQRNIIKIWKNKEVTKGLISTELKLSDEPNLGEWTIEAKVGEQIDTHEVSVEQYILPKFNVQIKLPNYITINSSRLIVEVKAMYTYGKELQGLCTISLSQKRYYYDSFNTKKTVTKTLSINGTVIVEYESIKDDPILFGSQQFYNEMEFEVIATVKDNITGKEQNGTSTIKMYEYPYKITYIDAPTSYQPGLPFKMSFKVTTQDDIPIEDSTPDAFIINHGFSYNWEDSIIKCSIPSNGIVSFTFLTSTNDLISTSNVELTYKNLKQTIYLPQRMHSTSRIYIQLNLLKENVTTGEEMEFSIKATKELNSFTYTIYGRGLILGSEKIILPAPAKEYTFKVTAPTDTGSEGKIVVYTVFPPNNDIVVANMIKFNMDSTLKSNLNIKLSAETLEPGENVTISTVTKMDSIVALRGVDQSVLILKKDKDITVETFQDELKNVEQIRNGYSRLWGGSSTFQIFEEASLVIITNGILEKDRNVPYYPRFGVPIALPMMMMDSNSAGGAFGISSKKVAMNSGAERISVRTSNDDAVDIRVRKDFPETWLWEEFWVNDKNNSFSFDKIVPDTITSWAVTGFSINSKFGIGVSIKPQMLTTFRPFFISLNLPYSIVKDEVLSLQVLVHNYMSEEISATLTFDNKDLQFKFINNEDNSISKVEQVTVGPSQVTSKRFIIIPQKIGTIILNIKGVTSNAGDGLSQPLIVKPPGHKQTKNQAVFIDQRNETKSTIQYNLVANFPTKRVDGADSIKISVIADILGATISNLDKLLEMPCGCGEQNMVNFVPDIVILNYLKNSETLTESIKSKAIRFLESGYQQELTYKHSDGSFSAFGNSDPIGSTWLTAFVVKSFIGAKPYITIDDNIIIQALNFLVLQQEENGSFKELGHVLNSDMQGSSSSTGLALTAYTLLAFIEFSKISKTNAKTYSTQISKGLKYISNTKHFKSKDTYALNLIAYTLDKANHTKKEDFFNFMDSKAVLSKDTMYWETKVKTVKISKTNKLESLTKPASVEMTAYALLTYIRRENIDNSLKITKWLLKQRNAEGGFLSTQDTVVGLTALANFASLIKSKETNIIIQAKYEDGTQEIIINNENAVTLQEFYLPKSTRSINLTVSGKGTALAQLTWTYYLKEDEITKSAFKINIEVKSEPPKLELNICTSFTVGNSSNMAVMEVNVPSGYSINTDNLNQLREIQRLKRYELKDGDTTLFIYFESILENKTCIDITALKIFSIRKHAPTYVLMYDYYDTTKKARAFYNVPTKDEDENCKKCDAEDNDCDNTSCPAAAA